MTGEAERLLSTLPLLRGVGQAEIMKAAERSLWKSYARGATIFRRGEPCRGLFVVADGQVEVYRATPDGREQSLHTHGAGVAFGEVPLFDCGPYPASARAVEPSRVLLLPVRSFHTLLRDHPAMAAAVVADLGRRLRRMVALVEKISLRDVFARVALTLMEQSERVGVDDAAGFHLPQTQEQLATELATSRESVSRALNRLEREGIIQRRGTHVLIRDRVRLERASLPT